MAKGWAPPPASAICQSTTRRKTSDALVPPKPNEFDRTTSISFFFDRCGTRSIGVSTDGLSRLMVGGTTPSRMRQDREDRLHRARCAQQMADRGLGRGHTHASGRVADEPLHGAEFDLVAERRRGAVRVDVVDLGWRDAGALDRRGHAAERAVAIWRRRRDMIGVARKPVADQLGVDFGAARLGVLVFLEHDHAGALGQHEAVAVLVVGPRGACRRRR